MHDFVSLKDHYVYRYYGPDGVLLYVGETDDPNRRREEHRRQSGWFTIFAAGGRCEVTTVIGQTAAKALEALLIRGLAPLYNLRVPSEQEVERLVEKAGGENRIIEDPSWYEFFIEATRRNVALVTTDDPDSQGRAVRAATKSTTARYRALEAEYQRVLAIMDSERRSALASPALVRDRDALIQRHRDIYADGSALVLEVVLAGPNFHLSDTEAWVADRVPEFSFLSALTGEQTGAVEDVMRSAVRLLALTQGRDRQALNATVDALIRDRREPGFAAVHAETSVSEVLRSVADVAPPGVANHPYWDQGLTALEPVRCLSWREVDENHYNSALENAADHYGSDGPARLVLASLSAAARHSGWAVPMLAGGPW